MNVLIAGISKLGAVTRAAVDAVVKFIGMPFAVAHIKNPPLQGKVGNLKIFRMGNQRAWYPLGLENRPLIVSL